MTRWGGHVVRTGFSSGKVMTLTRRPKLACLGAVIVLVGTMGFSEQPASADPFGGEAGGYPWRADGADHWYCFSNIPADQQYRYHNALSVLDNQTDMWDVHTGTCGSSTDIAYFINVNLAARGAAICVRLVAGSTTVCDAYWVALNPFAVLADPGTAGFDISYNKTIVHETGHTAGLTHNDTTVSAMRSGAIPTLGGYNFLWGLYENHHVGHINAAY